jgi:hypothetical protein
MRLPFDVYRHETSGSLRWIEDTATLEDAQALVQKLSTASPGGYLIFNYRTGDKLIFKPDSFQGIAASARSSAG